MQPDRRTAPYPNLHTFDSRWNVSTGPGRVHQYIEDRMPALLRYADPHSYYAFLLQ